MGRQSVDLADGCLGVETDFGRGWFRNGSCVQSQLWKFRVYGASDYPTRAPSTVVLSIDSFTTRNHRHDSHGILRH